MRAISVLTNNGMSMFSIAPTFSAFIHTTQKRPGWLTGKWRKMEMRRSGVSLAGARQCGWFSFHWDGVGQFGAPSQCGL
jgi:hypothetical protein